MISFMTLSLPLLFPVFMLGWVFKTFKLVVTAQKDFACNRVVRLKTAISFQSFHFNSGFIPEVESEEFILQHCLIVVWGLWLWL